MGGGAGPEEAGVPEVVSSVLVAEGLSLALAAEEEDQRGDIEEQADGRRDEGDDLEATDVRDSSGQAVGAREVQHLHPRTPPTLVRLERARECVGVAGAHVEGECATKLPHFLHRLPAHPHTLVSHSPGVMRAAGQGGGTGGHSVL
eukprot:1404626-Rhodomonas_salina.1